MNDSWLRGAVAYILAAALLPATVGAQTLGESLAAGDFDQAAAQAQGDHYLAELIRRAEEGKLDRNPVWHALLHYKPGLLGSYESEVDGQDFFTSARGKTDPAQELRATLASLFSGVELPPYKLTPQCRFPARYLWLSRQLQVDPARLPAQSCQRLDIFMQALQADGLSVVFPASHPNSPSSMFGHTLMRVDRKGQTPATRMLDYTINYAAEADDSGGIAYAVKGLAGGFLGKFRVIPYYMKLREYAQMENRDIWEYRIAVEPQALDLMLRHAWELLPTHFDYYFFTENCAYHLLSLLEVDPANQGMTDAFTWYVLPVDTLRVLEGRGLVREVAYYPSHYRIIDARRAQVTHGENALAMAISRAGLAPHAPELATYAPERHAVVLDLAYDYLRYDRIAREELVGAELSERERELLLARSRLEVVTQVPDIPPPTLRPDHGHPAARLHAGVGSDDGGDFLELGWRAVYHDWLDPLPGYDSNFALEFGRLDARYYRTDDGGDEFRLERLHLIHIDYFEPRDDFFGRISWSVTTGLEALSARPQRHDLMYLLRGGPGMTLGLNGESLLLYGLLAGEAAYSPEFRHDLNAALGAEAGVIAHAGPWRMKLTARHLADVSSNEWDRSTVDLSQSWAMSDRLALQLSLGRERLLDGWRGAAKAGVYVYY